MFTFNISIPQQVRKLQLESDTHWMSHALRLAHKAQEQGEVPVGAVLVQGDEVIGEGWNQPILSRDPSAHAEINALRSAAKTLGNYRLVNTTLYVTLEPCVMCAGAIVHARVARVVYGASDPKAGAAGSVFNILQSDDLNHQVDVCGGIMPEECGDILRTFFQSRR